MKSDHVSDIDKSTAESKKQCICIHKIFNTFRPRRYDAQTCSARVVSEQIALLKAIAPIHTIPPMPGPYVEAVGGEVSLVNGLLDNTLFRTLFALLYQ